MKVLYKLPKTVVVDSRERLISKFEKHTVRNLQQDYHLQHGFIKKSDLAKKDGSMIKSSSGEEFYLHSSDFIDEYKQMKRLAQIITLKDIGPIITYAGLNKNSVVLESGTGSGGLTCYLAKVVKYVTSIEQSKEQLEVAKKNVKNLSITNVDFHNADMYEPLKIKTRYSAYDCVVLDLPEPDKTIHNAKKFLKIGGTLVGYITQISQVQKFVTTLPKEFLVEKIINIMEQEWVVDEKRSRPATKDIGFTGFLVFVRRIGK